MSSRTADLTGLALPAAGAIAGGGCAVVLYLVNPHSHQVFVPCPFHAATGLYCPACGGLRMMHDLLHGDLTAALHDDALAIPAVIIGFAAWLYWTICRWRGRPAPARPTWLSPVIIAVLIVWTVVRNLPWAPFAALRPTALRRLRYLGGVISAALSRRLAVRGSRVPGSLQRLAAAPREAGRCCRWRSARPRKVRRTSLASWQYGGRRAAAPACWPSADGSAGASVGHTSTKRASLSRLSGLCAWRSGIPDRHAHNDAH